MSETKPEPIVQADEAERMWAAIEAVRWLHSPDGHPTLPYCKICGTPWPCQTIDLLNEVTR